MDRKTFLELLEKYQNGTVTEEERQFLDVYYRLFEKDSDVLRQLSENERRKLKDRIKRRVDNKIVQNKPSRPFRPYWSYAAAAAVILGLLIFLYKPTSLEHHHITTYQDSIVPGKNTAMLVLENGKQIVLSDLHKGIVMGDTIKYENGKLLDETIDGQMLTLQTPRGGQYQVTLPDGTRVWLNAASTLQYPARFRSSERRVYLEGEAYFDVVEMVSSGNGEPDYRVPFSVESNGQTVDVLGTEFNISAYDDDQVIRTTLVEGRVNVLFNDVVHTNGLYLVNSIRGNNLPYKTGI